MSGGIRDVGYRIRTLSGVRHLGAVVLLFLAAAPLLVAEIYLLKLAGAFFFAVFAMSWDFTSGYTGELSFGHSLFFAVGGYTTGILNVHFGVDPIVGILLGGLAAAAAGLLVGLPTLRLSGPYFALITLIVPLALLELFAYARDYTGGRSGLVGVESLTANATATYYLGFGTFLVALSVFLVVTRSDVGSIFTAIREDEDAVVASGLNPAKFKIYSFAFSGLIGGFAAAVFVHTVVGTVSPSLLLALVVNINVILAVILGGMGTITASAAGGIFFFLLRDYLGSVEWTLPVVGVSVGELNTLVFFVLLLVLLFYLPEGLFVRIYELLRASVGDDERKGVVTDGGAPPLKQALRKLREQIRDRW